MELYESLLIDNFLQYWWIFLIVAAEAYLLGSINPAVIVTKVATKGKSDIRELGSGNAGFTNVLRSIGKLPAVITIVCDALKAVIAVLLGGYLFSLIGLDISNEILRAEFVNCGKFIAGIFCVLGHAYPIYFRFKGGKGVVTAAALMAVEDWRVFLMILCTFLIVFIISKIISLSSIICAVLYGPYTFFAAFVLDYLISGSQYHLGYVVMSTLSALIIGVFVTVRHSENISRLLKGEEKKITAKKK